MNKVITMIYTEGIVLKQIKTGEDRRIIILFTKKLGKVSAASKVFYYQKNKSSAVLHPFNYGKYVLYPGKEIYNINKGEVINSFYKIGEDIDKYACSSYILEFTDKILPENQMDIYLFELLRDFLEIIEKRNKKYMLIIRAYEIKSLVHMGIMPELNKCVKCGNFETSKFSIEEGGLLCDACICDETLIFNLNHNIIEVIKYIGKHPLKRLEKLDMDKKVLEELNIFMKKYLEYHVQLNNMKSMDFLNTCLVDETEKRE